MKDSLFNDRYTEEQTRCLLDNLNLLYVAFTRAELGLYAFCPQNTHATKNQSSIAKSILEALMASSVLSAHLNEHSFKMGAFTSGNRSEALSHSLIVIDQYLTGNWRSKLAIKAHEKRVALKAEEVVDVAGD